MKRYLLLLIILFSFLKSSLSQTLYGNEWIFDYSKTYYKIKVAEDGLYRLPIGVLQNAGLSNIQGNDLVLFGRGAEIPIYVTSTGLLSATDYIEFYAQKNDGWFDSLLYRHAWQEQLNPYYSFANDTAIYFLTTQTGINHKRVLNFTNNTSGQPAETFYYHTSLYENHGSYAGGYSHNYGGGSIVSTSSFDHGEGFFGLFFNSTATQNISTPFVYTGSGTNGFSVNIITSSVYEGPNNITVSVGLGANSYSFGNKSFFDIQTNYFTANNLSPSILSNLTPINFAVNAPGNYQAVSAIKITYPRQFDFGNESQMSFKIANNVSSYPNKHIVINNFNSLGSNAILYDFSTNLRLVSNYVGGSTFKFLLPSSSTTLRDLHISSENQIKTITSVDVRKFVDYSNTIHQGNYFIISHSSLRNDGSGIDYVQRYGAYRSQLDGGSYDTLIADIDVLYDEFAYGIAKHPLSIRNFLKYANDKFLNAKPFHAFLVGKGQVYADYRRNLSRYNLCKIPTYGNPGSDNLLAGFNNDYFPHMAIGRLSAFTAEDVKVYLDKIQEYERAQRESCISGEQTLAKKDWMKQVIHLSGGKDVYEQSLFDGFLNTGAGNPNGLPSMKSWVEDTLFGANVNIFKKSSSAPVQISASYQLDSLINNGVSIINFFGHSAFSTLEFAIDNPASYKNYGKYPVLISNGCFTGNLFEDPSLDPYKRRGLSERFLMPDAGYAKNIGAIAYLSTSDLGVSSGLNYYSNTLLKNISAKHYGATLGECIRIAVDSMSRPMPISVVDLVASGEQMLLHGDPAIRINPHTKPDYIIEPSLIKINPSIVTFESGNTFQLNFKVENIGLVKNDSINILVFRYFPKDDLTANNTPTLLKSIRIKAPSYQQNFSIPVNTVQDKALGTNRICIAIDANNEIDEICENNNEACIEFEISSLDILPIWPYQYSIVADTSAFMLKANTVDPLAPNRKYYFEIDTSKKFNSPLLRTTAIINTGGVINFRPNLKWITNKVYYWRVSVDTIYGNHFIRWHNTSFTYLPGSSPGWDQSHFYEFKEDNLTTLTIDSVTHKFKFADNIRSVKIKDFGNGTDDQVAPYLDYNKLNNGGSCIPYASFNGPAGTYGGFNIVVFDSSSGAPKQNGYGVQPQLGDYSCGRKEIPIFQYLTKGYITSNTWRSLAYCVAANDSMQRIYFDDFLNNYVRTGDYVLMYSIADYSPKTFGTSLKNTIKNLFKTNVIDTMTTSRTYVLFGKKGAFGYPTNEVQSATIGGVIDTTFYFSGNWYQGEITSPLIGPAKEWTTLNYNYNAQETPSADTTTIQLIGVDVNGNETVIYQNSTVNVLSYPLSWISPSQYPYLRLKMITKDDVDRTPANLNYWRINYQPLPEIALSKNLSYNFYADTLMQGEKLIVKMVAQNISKYSIDTVQLKYIITKNNNQKDSAYVRLKPIVKGDTLQFQFNQSTLNYAGKNMLIVDVNPLDFKHQPEQFHYNNTARFNFFVKQDKINPILDVTFDGQRIMDGDLVSAKPHIAIKLNDENKYLPLDNINLLTASLKLPDATNFEPLTTANAAAKFTPPANAKQSNTATLELNPTLLKDGLYQLRVQGHDQNNNVSGNLDYVISFNVINKSSITNILNYPNPFTAQTRFVFTLTGSEIPSYFKIQIFTISGKVVKEIKLTQGLHVGNNISNEMWDGTDDFGQPLGNGVYLYRVVTNINNTKIEHFTKDFDKYFKSGFGKMYLMR